MPDGNSEATMCLSLKKYLDTGLYSDLRIKDSDGHEYAVHRILGCGQSPVLENACKPESGFKDDETQELTLVPSAVQEAQSGVVDLKDDDPSAVKAMLEFMYRGTFTIPGDAVSPILFAVRAYIIADIYAVPNMKKIATAKFSELASVNYKNPNFVTALRVIYESAQDNDKGCMRETAVDIVSKHYDLLLANSAFEAVLDDHGALGKDILRALLRKANAPKAAKYMCRHGGRIEQFVEMIIDHGHPHNKSSCINCNISLSNNEWKKRMVVT
ncbi:putative btb poz domain protein [Neofusicoccum parvum UCRNP2]|uniref:Putative btb poz domain protein n=1 Tax=Botryosphaeria parva (strain UCR-NP2) TaxID=1287680 RepID=R1EPC0_BOTPV|nr:putative btb poz domain protein [Neofusicoccum parvum UCRNP2]